VPLDRLCRVHARYRVLLERNAAALSAHSRLAAELERCLAGLLQDDAAAASSDMVRTLAARLATQADAAANDGELSLAAAAADGHGADAAPPGAAPAHDEHTM